jgi:DnaJ-class molecular chaperone
MADPYATLGVKREASAEEIKRAYRKLAKTWHPDHNKDNPKAAARFSEINSAYEILGDEAKRKSFDRGEIDGDGKPRFTGNPFEGAGAGAGGPGGFRYDFGTSGPFGGARGGDPRDIFSDLFRKFETGGPDPARGQARSQGGRSPIPPGDDIALEAAVSLETIASGGTIRVTIYDGRSLEVKVPAGAANGSTMRLKGQGRPSHFGGANGDVLVTLRYQRHARFTADGVDLRVAVPVPIRDAVVGGALRVPTLDGEVELTIPAWTSGGKTLRLKGKGLPSKERQGDLYVTLDIDLGPHDPEMEGYFRRRKG